MRRLVSGHDEVVLGGNVVAAVARPADVERLALDGAARHLYELVHHAHLGGIVEQRVVDDRAVHQRKRKVAHVDGQPHALGEVQAGLAAAQLGLVGDVIMDKRRRMEMFDGGRRARGARHVAAHRTAGREADERTVALAAVLAVRVERLVQVAVHVGVRSRGDVRVHQRSHLGGVAGEVFFEGLGRLFDGRDDVVDVVHNAFFARRIGSAPKRAHRARRDSLSNRTTRFSRTMNRQGDRQHHLRENCMAGVEYAKPVHGALRAAKST